MKVYLVGGAVRDQLLGYPVKERDWVVVGSTADALQKAGFQKVGADFPVFLHPQTREEYALARKERKSAPGYYGFECDYSKSVSLEEDLARRDLTINAMAMDEKGYIIDPYQGRADLDARLLRHVTDAFVDDPVRVLRVARFAARYAHLGFKVAPETRLLMYQMVQQGELSHLVPERVWQEWLKSLEEAHPSVFIETLRACGALAVIFPEIDALFGVPNPAHYHREIDSGIHTCLVLDAASRLSSDPLVRFAALMHDLGKALTPMAFWPKHHGHEERGIKPIEALCSRLRVPKSYRQLALLAANYHLTLHRVFELRPSTIVTLLERLDAFRRPAFFQQLLWVCEADARGCGRDEVIYPQRPYWEALFAACSSVDKTTWTEKNLHGKAIGEKIHQERIQLVKQFIDKQDKVNET